MDKESKLIVDFETSTACIHDSQLIENLIKDQPAGSTLHGDSAYRSEKIEQLLKQKKIISQIHEKGSRGNPLTQVQKNKNHLKSKIRAKVEHPFAWMHRNCQQLLVRTVGLQRATAKITLLNLIYNMSRAVHLITSKGKELSIL